MASVMRRMGRTMNHCRLRYTRPAVISEMTIESCRMRFEYPYMASRIGPSSITTSTVTEESLGAAPITRNTRFSVSARAAKASRNQTKGVPSPRSMVASTIGGMSLLADSSRRPERVSTIA